MLVVNFYSGSTSAPKHQLQLASEWHVPRALPKNPPKNEQNQRHVPCATKTPKVQRKLVLSDIFNHVIDLHHLQTQKYSLLQELCYFNSTVLRNYDLNVWI